MLHKLPSDMSYDAIDCEFKVNNNIYEIRYFKQKHT